MVHVFNLYLQIHFSVQEQIFARLHHLVWEIQQYIITSSESIPKFHEFHLLNKLLKVKKNCEKQCSQCQPFSFTLRDTPQPNLPHKPTKKHRGQIHEKNQWKNPSQLFFRSWNPTLPPQCFAMTVPKHQQKNTIDQYMHNFIDISLF